MTTMPRFVSNAQRLTRAVTVVAALVIICSAATAEAGRSRGRRGPSPQQIQKMKEEMAYRQHEVQRVQQETAAIHQSIFKQFDENGDGRLLGPEKSKYDKHMYHIQSGKAPNPFAAIKPLGQGPHSPSAGK